MVVDGLLVREKQVDLVLVVHIQQLLQVLMVIYILTPNLLRKHYEAQQHQIKEILVVLVFLEICLLVVVAALAQQVEMLVATPLEMVVKDYE